MTDTSSDMVELESNVSEPSSSTTPAPDGAVLPLTVQSSSVAVPSFRRAPAYWAELPLIAQSSSTSVAPEFPAEIPPPW